MKIYEVISEDQFDWEAETAEEIYLADPQGRPRIGAYKPGMQGLDHRQIARVAKGQSGRFPNNQRGAIRAVIDNITNKKSQPKKTSTPTPAPTPAAKQGSDGRQLKHKRFHGEKPVSQATTAVGKHIQKGKDLGKALGGIGRGVQRRSRKLSDS